MPETNQPGVAGHRIRDLRGLPLDIEPARDLWPGIAGAIGYAPRARAQSAMPAPRLRPWWLAGLAFAPALVVALAILWRADGSPGSNPGNTQYAALSPQERAVVDEALAAIRGSRQQLEAALAEDGGSPELQAMLVNAYFEESRVLQLVGDFQVGYE